MARYTIIVEDVERDGEPAVSMRCTAEGQGIEVTRAQALVEEIRDKFQSGELHWHALEDVEMPTRPN